MPGFSYLFWRSGYCFGVPVFDISFRDITHLHATFSPPHLFGSSFKVGYLNSNNNTFIAAAVVKLFPDYYTRYVHYMDVSIQWLAAYVCSRSGTGPWASHSDILGFGTLLKGTPAFLWKCPSSSASCPLSHFFGSAGTCAAFHLLQELELGGTSQLSCHPSS